MYAKNSYQRGDSFQRYRAVKIQTASPAQVMLMLYDGAIRFAQIAQQKIEARDIAGKGVYINKTQAIISELMSSLDFSVSPELCERLEQLYLYMMEQLTEANLHLKTEPLKIVVDLLNTLRGAWGEALASLPQDPTAQPAVAAPAQPSAAPRAA
ncbi:flagellar export chaperone FliS, partial [Myxococcota bacterium]|nr:flagellar export chaperone FliS [Myxococcota bacterium]